MRSGTASRVGLREGLLSSNGGPSSSGELSSKGVEMCKLETANLGWAETVPVYRIPINFHRAHSFDDLFRTLSLEVAVGLEEPHRDLLRAYRTLASFCSFSCTKIVK
jgi:hypothetical protein